MSRALAVPSPSALVRLQRNQADALRRDDLFSFLWTAFDALNQDRGEAFVANWHLKAMCWELTRLAKGEERRLLVTIPPRHLKTITTSVAFVAWLMGHDPTLRIIVASYGQNLASKILSDLRRVMESAPYRRLFPDVRLRAVGPELKTSKDGSVRATSVGGTVTGIGADYIIADDLLKASDAASPQMREDAFSFYQHSLVSRLDDKSRGRIVLVQQRLHADDVAGRLLEAGGFRHLNLPAIAEEDQRIEIGPDRIHERRVGDVLFEEREPLEVLDALRKEMGSAVFGPQYQQNTEGAGSDLFRWSWFETYEARPHRGEFDMVVQSVDTAFSDGADADWSVCLTFGRKAEDWYLVDVHRTKDSYSAFKASLLGLAGRWAVDRIIVEQAGAGIPLVRECMREHGLAGKVFSFKPRTSKQERFATQIERLKHGRFLLPRDASWLAEFRREMTAFPNGRHDDQVDALTQFLDWLGSRRTIAALRRLNGDDMRRR